jgi:hypothetical protein
MLSPNRHIVVQQVQISYRNNETNEYLNVPFEQILIERQQEIVVPSNNLNERNEKN